MWRDSWLLCFETTLVTLVQLFQNEEKKSQMCRLDQQFARFHLSWILRPHSFFSKSFSKHQIGAYKKKPKMMFFHGSIRHLICFKIFFFIISHLYLQLGKEPRARGTKRVLHLCSVPHSTWKLSAAPTRPHLMEHRALPPAREEGFQCLIISQPEWICRLIDVWEGRHLLL